MISLSSRISPACLKGILQARKNRDTQILSGVTPPMNTCKLYLLWFVNYLFCLYWIFKGKCDNPTVLQMLNRVFHLIKPVQQNGLKQRGTFVIWDLWKNFNIRHCKLYLKNIIGRIKVECLTNICFSSLSIFILLSLMWGQDKMGCVLGDYSPS